METARHPRLFYHVRERCAYSGPTTASPSNGRRNSTLSRRPRTAYERPLTDILRTPGNLEHGLGAYSGPT